VACAAYLSGAPHDVDFAGLLAQAHLVDECPRIDHVFRRRAAAPFAIARGSAPNVQREMSVADECRLSPGPRANVTHHDFLAARAGKLPSFPAAGFTMPPPHSVAPAARHARP